MIVFLLILQTLINSYLLLQWTIYPKINFTMIFLVDTLTSIFLFTVSLITLRVLIFRKSYIILDKSNKKFYFLLILFVFSIFLLILSPRNLRILLGWDGLGLSSYLLVIYYNSNKANTSGIITLLINRFGDALILLRLFWQISSFSWITPETWDLKQIKAFTTLFSLGLITKSAQIPFSSWLPAAIAAPTPVSSLVHSSTLVTAGVYLIIRLNNIFKKINLSNTLVILGRTTALIARLLALKENDMKKVVALSTLRQLGFIVIILGLNCWYLAFRHLINHAFFKALLFIATGNIIHSTRDSQDLKTTGQKINQIYNTKIIVFLATTRITGLTFLSAFYAKEIIIENIILSSTSLLIPVFLRINLLLTPIYAIRRIIIFYFLNLKQFNKNYRENSDPVVGVRILILTPPTFTSGFIINKIYYWKEQSLISSILYISIVLIIRLLTVFLIYFLKYHKILTLFINRSYTYTIWGLTIIYLKWAPAISSLVPKLIITEEKKLLTKSFNLLFHEQLITAQPASIYTTRLLLITLATASIFIFYYLNNTNI